MTAPAGEPTAPDAPPSRRTGLLLGAALAVVALDQLTKLWALAALRDGPLPLIGPVRLALTRNTGAAFGLGGRAVPFLAVAALGLVVAAATSRATARPAVAVALGLVLGGAVGNLVDRVIRGPGLLQGAVVDFVDLTWWPVFNLADAAITCGSLLLLVLGWSPRPARP